MMTELNSQNLNSRLDHAKERSFKIIRSKKQKGKKMKRKEESLWDLQGTLTETIHTPLESQKKRGRKG